MLRSAKKLINRRPVGLIDHDMMVVFLRLLQVGRQVMTPTVYTPILAAERGRLGFYAGDALRGLLDRDAR